MNDKDNKPWGGFVVLEKGEGYQVKRIWLYPKQRLSLQSHNHRDEYWVVVKGPARIQVGTEFSDYANGTGCFIPRTIAHRLENHTEHIIQIIEIQYGTIINEEDITRYEDDYNRS